MSKWEYESEFDLKDLVKRFVPYLHFVVLGFEKILIKIGITKKRICDPCGSILMLVWQQMKICIEGRTK